jgi:putative heme-binding domain-containing protein
MCLLNRVIAFVGASLACAVSTDAQHADWTPITVPHPDGWEVQAEGVFGAHDGFAWYRAYVKIPADWEGSRILLIAGAIDNVDEGFFNGRRIGSNGSMPPLYGDPSSNIRRPFVIEPDWVRFGEDNLIAWRIYDKGGKGGIISGPIHLTRTEDAIDLSGQWLFRAGDAPAWADWWNPAGSSEAAEEANSFRELAGVGFAGNSGVILADKRHREEMIAAVYKKFEGNSNPYALNDDKGKPLNPEDSRATLELADGLAIDTVLSEPLVRQPLYVDFDERGRLWVIQYIQYPNPAGLEVLTWDNHLRKIFDQVPPPPPYSTPEKEKFLGRDRVTIHEDTNGDGVYDSHKIFAQGLNLATSVTRGRGGVWLMHPPYLLFYPDADNDDVPDSDPVVHLSGFGLEDTHSIANSLKWGPDGWLYGGTGSTVTARVKVHLSNSGDRYTFFGQNIWRYHPEKHVFELFAEGGWNTFGVDFDDKGRVYSGTNGNLQAVYFVQGGYYQKGFGKHGPHTNPYAFGHFFGLPIEGEKIRLVHQWIHYNSGAIPSLEGLLVGGNSLGSKLHALQMETKGSTFSTVERPNPVKTSHKWFRPVHCTAGPDGGIYISDFYDARITHVDPRDNWDRERGRILRLRNSDAGFAKARDLGSLTSPELVKVLVDRNQWARRTAQRLLADRADGSVLPQLLELLRGEDAQSALGGLWAIHGVGEFNDSVALEAMSHADPHVRLWAVRLLGDTGATLLKDANDGVTKLAATEKHAEVISQLAATAQRLPSPQALPLVRILAGRSEFAADDYIPQQIWWALEAQITQDPLRALALLEESEFWNQKIFAEVLAERIGRRFMADRSDANMEICAKLLDRAPDTDSVKLLIHGMEQALEGMALSSIPKSLDVALGRLWSRFPNDDAVVSFALRLNSQEALKVARDAVANSAKSEALRLSYIGKLAELGDRDLESVLLKLVQDESASATLRKEAISALRRYSGAGIPAGLLGVYSKLEPDLQKTTQAVLSGRAPWSLTLLEAVDSGSVARESLTFDNLLLIQSRGQEAANALIKKHWGSLRQPAEAKTRRIEEVGKILAAGPKGNLEKGRELFTASCGACHKLGDVGREIAPDLTGYERGNLEFMLPAIIDPNLGVREEFELATVILRAEEGSEPTILTGFISNASEQAITVKDLVGNETVVARRDVASESRAPISVMPEGLIDSLTEEQIRNLFAFLQASVKE